MPLSDEALRRHIISLGNNGRLMSAGPFGTTQDSLLASIKRMMDATASWDVRRIMLYAHGGVVDEASAVRWVRENAELYLAQGIYPLCFVWHSDPWSTFKDTIKDVFLKRKGELQTLEVFDPINRAVEKAIRDVQAIRDVTWLQMKDNAIRASVALDGGARIVAGELSKLKHAGAPMEIHLVGHSAGGVLHAPLTQLLSTPGNISSGPARGQHGFGLPVDSVTLWAPGCTIDVFHSAYKTALDTSRLKRFALYTLTDDLERKDEVSSWLYGHSILYLVSNGFEGEANTPILGMEKFVPADAFGADNRRWVKSVSSASAALKHGAFDEDAVTRESTARWIVSGA